MQADDAKLVMQAIKTIERSLKRDHALSDFVVTTDTEARQLIKELSFLSLAPKENETFAVIGMTNKHKFIGITEFYKGTVDKCTVHSRPIVSWALQHNVAAVIFVHNHPSGNTYPSQADINMTETLKKSLALIDVRVLDHFIVGSNMSSMFSFRENGLLT